MKPHDVTTPELCPASSTSQIHPAVWAVVFALFCLAGAGIWFFL